MAGKPPKRRCEIIDDGIDGASDTSEKEIYFELSGEEDTAGFRGFEQPTAVQSPVASTSRQSKPSTSRESTPADHQSPVASTSRQSKPSTSRESTPADHQSPVASTSRQSKPSSRQS
jgi:hypothetical protein